MLWCLWRYKMIHCIYIKNSCKKNQFCQAIPSTFCLHMQFPLLGSHFGVLLKLPSGRQLQSVHPEGPKSQEVSSQASHCCPVTPGLHSHCPSSAHCCLTDPINGILRFFHNSILTTFIAVVSFTDQKSRFLPVLSHMQSTHGTLPWSSFSLDL